MTKLQVVTKNLHPVPNYSFNQIFFNLLQFLLHIQKQIEEISAELTAYLHRMFYLKNQISYKKCESFSIS